MLIAEPKDIYNPQKTHNEVPKYESGREATKIAQLEYGFTAYTVPSGDELLPAQKRLATKLRQLQFLKEEED